MSVQTEIDRISTAVQNAHLKVIEKGGTSAAPYLVANLEEAIGTIPEATEPTLQSKTVSPSTSAQTVKPDSGYDGLSQVTVNAMTTATQATPAISVDSDGLITASATQTAGYVAAGTKSATKQLTAQAAQTITPGTADKTIASGRYLTGTQTIKGDANLVAGNIKSGVSIFGVAGTVEEGEDVTAETTEYTDLLTDLEAAVDALPDAGSGSGAVETCSVRLYADDYLCQLLTVSYTSVDSSGNVTNVGKTIGSYGTYNFDVTIENVVRNRPITLGIYFEYGGLYTTNEAVNIYFYNSEIGIACLDISASNDTTVTVYLGDND